MGKILTLVACILLLYGTTGLAAAQTPTSTNYSLPESYIGPGGSVDSSSPNYRGSDTIGDTATGNASSSSFSAQDGFNTASEPRLAVAIGSSSVNFGGFSTSVTSTGTATFNVLNYTTNGYGVYIVGAPPKTGSYTLAGMSSTGTSAIGTEQFGINLRANTAPATFGSDPVQIPSGSFSFGSVSTGYNTVNNFRYIAGEKIAEATKNSGETDYTISYIVNTATTTAGGQYSASQGLVVVGTY
jgi:hypothetical protein